VKDISYFKKCLFLLRFVTLYKNSLNTACTPSTSLTKSDPVSGPVWPRGWVELHLYSSMTAALEGGEWSATRPGRTLPPGKEPVPILQEAGWAPGPVWTGGKSRPHRDSIPNRPARSQSIYRLSYWAHQHLLHACLLSNHF